MDGKCEGSSCIAYDYRGKKCSLDQELKELGDLCTHERYQDPQFQQEMLVAYASGLEAIQIKEAMARL